MLISLNDVIMPECNLENDDKVVGMQGPQMQQTQPVITVP